MQVVAKRPGYYDNVRRYPAGYPNLGAGKPFVLKAKKGHVQDPKTGRLIEHVFTPEEQFSPHWMEKVEDAQKPGKGKKKSQDDVPVAEATGDQEVI